jgi:hypothetical protein
MSVTHLLRTLLFFMELRPFPRAACSSATTQTYGHPAYTHGVAVVISCFVCLQVAAQEGRLLFMTTNHIERLAPALIRPGRVDVRCAFGAATRQQAHDLFVSFYADMPPAAAAAAAAAGQGVTQASNHSEVAAADTAPPAEGGAGGKQVASSAAAVSSRQEPAGGAAPRAEAESAATAANLTRQELLKLAQQFAAALPREQLRAEQHSSGGNPPPVVAVADPEVPGLAGAGPAVAKAATSGPQAEIAAEVPGVVAGISMAALQGHLMSYKRDPWGAVAHAGQLGGASAGKQQALSAS